MNELLQALTDAARAGFDAPKCAKCSGSANVPKHGVVPPGSWSYGLHSDPCPACHATGLDASNPERLIGRAWMWLVEHDVNVISINEYYVERGFSGWKFGLKVTISPVYWSFRATKMEVFTSEPEYHDGTPAGLATALLRLVARVGGAS